MGRIGPSVLTRDDLGRKMCCMCKRWLSVAENFGVARANKDGLQTACLPCTAMRRRSRRFGVADDWFGITFAAQGGCCAICGSSEPRGRGWSIDHDHSCCPRIAGSCGKCIRGILCSPCNCALGMVADSPDVLRKAIAYLEANDRP